MRLELPISSVMLLIDSLDNLTSGCLKLASELKGVLAEETHEMLMERAAQARVLSRELMHELKDWTSKNS